MTIEVLEQEPKYCDRNICLRNEYNGIGCDECEVTKSQELTDENLHREREQAYMQGYEDTSKRFRQEPCEDAISRQAALDYLKANVDDFPDYHEAIEKILQMPSVNPQPKTGHWIIKSETSAVCSRCHKNNLFYGNFCKWCGEKMGEPQEREDE